MKIRFMGAEDLIYSLQKINYKKIGISTNDYKNRHGKDRRLNIDIDDRIFEHLLNQAHSDNYDDYMSNRPKYFASQNHHIGHKSGHALK